MFVTCTKSGNRIQILKRQTWIHCKWLQMYDINWDFIYLNHSLLIGRVCSRPMISILELFHSAVAWSMHCFSCQELQQSGEPLILVCNYIKTAANNCWTECLLYHSNQKFSGYLPAQPPSDLVAIKFALGFFLLRGEKKKSPFSLYYTHTHHTHTHTHDLNCYVIFPDLKYDSNYSEISSIWPTNNLSFPFGVYKL